MKGLILTGGMGSRLRPFTYTSAKQLVPIANKPVLFYAIENLVACGITDIVLVVGDTESQVRAAVGDGSALGAKICYLRQPAPLGIAHAVKLARAEIGDQPFVLYLGDNLIPGGIRDIVDRFHAERSTARIVLHAVPNPQAFGVAELNDGRLVRVVEKPKDPRTNLAVIGVYLFDHNVFDVIDSQQPSARGELEITDAIQGLIDGGFDVRTQELDRYWIDTGKMEDILAANRVVLDGLPAQARRSDGITVDERSRLHEPVHLAAGVVIKNSVLRGPLIVGAGTVIENCYIGPHTSIDHHCVLTGVRVSSSVILDHCTIEELHWPIESSLIGRNVTLRGGKAPGGAYSLTLGDFSRISMPESG